MASNPSRIAAVPPLLLFLTIVSASATSTGSCTLEQAVGRVFGSDHIEEPKVDSLDACCSQCAANKKCKAYTWADDLKTCFIKDNMSGDKSEKHRTSGRKAAVPTPSPPPANCTLQIGIQYLGNDVDTPAEVADEQACCSACAAESKCKFFTYEAATGTVSVTVTQPVNTVCHSWLWWSVSSEKQ